MAGFLELASDCPLYTSAGLESILLVTGLYGYGLDRYFAFALCIHIKEGRLFLTTVLTYGTFDLLHWEHIHLLERAADLGDRLIVGLSTDEFNAQKHKEAYNSYEHRKYILEAVRYVDEVIPERSWEQKIGDVQANNVDIFVVGSDWEGQFDFLREYCKVVYLPRTNGISTSEIKSDLKG